MIGKRLLARWDVSPEEQADRSFDAVLTLINLRRVEIACLLGIFTRTVELVTGFKSTTVLIEVPMMLVLLCGSLALRRVSNERLARMIVVVIVVGALLLSQWAIAALGAKGRLTSGYPMMLLSLTLLFVAPPRFVIGPLLAFFVTYCWIVSGTATTRPEQVIAIVNAALVTLICIVAAALIHSGRRRDYHQKREIRLQNSRLVERNDELDSLMAIAAHDLRSPLYGLRNLIDLAVRRAPQEPGLPLIVLRQAMTSLDAMLALATRLLDAHAAEHRPLDGLVRDDVRGHVLAAAERIGPQAQARGVQVSVDLPERALVAILNQGAIAQILDNLLSNAVRHSSAGGKIAFAAEHKVNHVDIRIQDGGRGVEPAALDHLFKRFHRSGGGGPDDLPGKGMGLFIVATLAERMTATVRYEPAAGGGALFIVQLAIDAPGLDIPA